MSTNESKAYEEDDYLHVGALILDYFRKLRATWFILVALVCIGGLCGYFYGKKAYTPMYSATAYFSVDGAYYSSDEAGVAGTIVSATRVITGTQDFRDDMLDEMGDDIYTDYGIVASLESGSNVFSVVIYGPDGERINHVLSVFEKVFPKWISQFTGSSISLYTEETLSDGIPYNSWSKGKMILVGIVGGFAIWFIIATIMILTSQKVHGESDMYKIVHSEKLGNVPKIKKKKRSDKNKETLLLSNRHVDTFYKKSIRMIRERFVRLTDENKKVFMITSTLPQEGKSTLSCNIALDLAENGYKVILLDADLYMNGSSKILSANLDRPGLSDYFLYEGNNDYPFDRLLQFKNGVGIISVGQSAEKFTGIVNQEKMTRLFNYVKEKADIIIVDTTPAGTTRDALQFIDFVDYVVYIIRGEYAEIKEIRNSIEPFVHSHKLAGYILNHVEGSFFQRRYGYGDYYTQNTYGRH